MKKNDFNVIIEKIDDLINKIENLLDLNNKNYYIETENNYEINFSEYDDWVNFMKMLTDNNIPFKNELEYGEQDFFVNNKTEDKLFAEYVDFVNKVNDLIQQQNNPETQKLCEKDERHGLLHIGIEENSKHIYLVCSSCDFKILVI